MTFKKRAVCLFLCIASAITLLCPVKTQASEESQVKEDVYYAKGALGELENSEALLYAYDRIVEGVEASSKEIKLVEGESTLSEAEFSTVFNAYIMDHAEHFWLDNAYSIMKNSKTVLSLKPTYKLSGEELNEARAEFDAAMESFLSLITPEMDEYTVELTLHDALASSVSYSESPHAHNAYGAMVLGKAVCEGYAEAFQCLLHKAGIRSLIVRGRSASPTTGKSEGHEWNMVRIDGKYYLVDLTWNDQESYTYHAYFNMTDEIFAKDHVTDPTSIPLPVCNSVDKSYFTVNSGFMTAYSAKSIAEKLSKDNLTTSVYINGDKKVFTNWFYANITNIRDELGISGGISYGYTTIGGEIVIYVDACEHKNLAFTPEKPESCTENGNLAYYVCDCGKIFLDSAAKNEVASLSLVVKRALGHVFVKTEDERYLRSEPENCLSSFTYWLCCKKCSQKSETDFFESDKKGAHTYAEGDGEKICLVCNTSADKKSPAVKLSTVLICAGAGVLVLSGFFYAIDNLSAKNSRKKKRKR